MTGLGAVALRAPDWPHPQRMFNGVLKLAYGANVLEGPSRFGNWVILSPVLGGLAVEAVP
jgi:chloride channel protein, CIC family